MDTTATGIGGILLIFLINGFDFSVRAVSLLILVLIGVWVYYALKIRKEYILSFQGKLGMSKDPVRRRGLQASDISAVEGIRKALLTGTEKQLLFLLSRIEDSKDQRLMGIRYLFYKIIQRLCDRPRCVVCTMETIIPL